MHDDFLILNIREYLRQGQSGEDLLQQVFSTFSCDKNLDVERFLLEQSINFTKKNQSVTYVVLTPEEGQIIGYFTITIKPITVNGDSFSNTVKKKIARVSEQDEEHHQQEDRSVLRKSQGQRDHSEGRTRLAEYHAGLS